MRVQRLLLMSFTLLLTMMLSSVLAQEIMVTPFEAIDVTCPEGGIVLSDNPMVAGRGEVVVYQGAGDPYFLVVSTWHPTAYPDSTFVVPGEGLDTPDGGFFVVHSGFGTGDLMGARIFYVVEPAVDMDDLPCEPVGPVVRIEGVIQHPMTP